MGARLRIAIKTGAAVAASVGTAAGIAVSGGIVALGIGAIIALSTKLDRLIAQNLR